uniref:NACHT domain-containing protein n=1 Tax=Esox lucius TaxID=8010 RepID=A0AAY5K985_ESOLU
MYTELYITEGGSLRLCKEHVQKGVSKATLKKRTTFETAIKCNDIIKPKQRERLHRYSIPGDLHKGIFLMNMDATAPSSPRSDRPPLYAPYHKKRKKRKGFRNLTKGIAGIGKTVSVQKVILDWAEGTANQDIHFIFPLPFRDLNLMKDQYSLMTLLSHYFPELKEIDRIEDGETKTVFIFDGLNECRFPLDFKNNKKFYDVTESTSVDVLLTNLIEGNLFPSAHIWITTRPAAAYQIPPEYVDQVTEIRGFSEPQKEEYFRKKITDQNLAIEIIKHIKSSRSLHIMCHLPVFCWISATVLETMLKETEKNEIPKTLTQMYSHFLLIQISVKNKKYNKDTETNPKDLSQADKELIFKLAKLAFQQLQKGNLIFYEEDLRECGVDVTEASEYSSLCTEIFKEESGLNPEKVFSFVHLSIQEFLAAVHCYNNSPCWLEQFFSSLEIGKSLQISSSPRKAFKTLKINGPFCYLHVIVLKMLYFLLCFTNYVLSRLAGCNLTYKSCKTLASALQTTNCPLRELDLRKNHLGDRGLKQLCSGPVIPLRNIQTLVLAGCNLTYKSCKTLASALQTPNSAQRKLILGDNDLGDRGVKLLCPGLTSPFCNLQTLDLNYCGLTEDCCSALAFVLRSPKSQLKHLELRENNLQDSGVRLLSAGLEDPNCKLQTLGLDYCNLTYKSCETLASALGNQNCPLRELVLSYNHLGDRGVKLLCAGLTSPLCNIQTLDLDYCGLTEDCCSDLVSVLHAPNSQLKQLELRDNDLKDSGVRLLSAGLEDPNCELQTLGYVKGIFLIASSHCIIFINITPSLNILLHPIN